MTSIQQIMIDQSPTPGGWICPQCKHHRGGIDCAKGFVIIVDGGNTRGCWGFEENGMVWCPNCLQWIAEAK